VESTLYVIAWVRLLQGGKTLGDTFTNDVKKHEDEKLDIEHEQGSGVG